MRPHPHLLEINTLSFLNRLSEQSSKRIGLSTIPDSEWKSIKQKGFDFVWLMGMWQRSKASEIAALEDSSLREEYQVAIPGWQKEDISGSPYAVKSYDVDVQLGSNEDLLDLKKKLNAFGLGLILDFVPNHLAKDHPWVKEHPEYFISTAKHRAVFKEHPEWFFGAGKNLLAYGRDPYFSPWNDTAQLNVFNHDTRRAMIAELKKVARFCDGVRCDMAMLLLNDVFCETWGSCVTRDSLGDEFWSEAIQTVIDQKPEFIFIAEVYWDLEIKLQSLGFNYTYNKVLYDRLLRSGPENIVTHIKEKEAFGERFVSFIENHDEPRASALFGREKSMAAAAVISTLPGMRLFQDGQAEGRKKRSPLQMPKEPAEETDHETLAFYEKLYDYADHKLLHEGTWQMLEGEPAFEKSDRHIEILAWIWYSDETWRLVTVNYAPQPSQAKFRIPKSLLSGKKVFLTDVLTNETYERYTSELEDDGLYVTLDPWQSHLFVVKDS